MGKNGRLQSPQPEKEPKPIIDKNRAADEVLPKVIDQIRCIHIDTNGRSAGAPVKEVVNAMIIEGFDEETTRSILKAITDAGEINTGDWRVESLSVHRVPDMSNSGAAAKPLSHRGSYVIV